MNLQQAPIFEPAVSGPQNTFPPIWQRWLQDLQVAVAALQASVQTGTGSPEGQVTASVGSVYLRTDGGAGTTIYVKESGTGNTGWAAK